MDEKANTKLRAGSIMVRIHNKFYEVPESCFFFKSHDNKDVYLSGVRNDTPTSFNAKWIGTIKFIEDNKFEDVPMELLERFVNKEYKKFVIDDEEYDIPRHLVDECIRKISKINKYNPKILKEIKESYKDFLFK